MPAMATIPKCMLLLCHSCTAMSIQDHSGKTHGQQQMINSCSVMKLLHIVLWPVYLVNVQFVGKSTITALIRVPYRIEKSLVVLTPWFLRMFLMELEELVHDQP